jgi:hypothetical protein
MTRRHFLISTSQRSHDIHLECELPLGEGRGTFDYRTMIIESLSDSPARNQGLLWLVACQDIGQVCTDMMPRHDLEVTLHHIDLCFDLVTICCIGLGGRPGSIWPFVLLM